MTFGFRRVEILSAQANGVTLLILAASSPTRRSAASFDPPHVRGGLMLVVALVGVLVQPRRGVAARAGRTATA